MGDIKQEPCSEELVGKRRMAEVLGVVPNTVLRYAANGVIPSVRMGPRLIRFDQAAVIKALKESGTQ